jgi:ribonuclease HII
LEVFISMIDGLYYDKGIQHLAGIDEAGRGPVAGPLVVAGVILPVPLFIKGIQDSKKCSPKERSLLYQQIIDEALKVSVKIIDVNAIDEGNIYRLTQDAMTTIAHELEADYTLTDAMRLTTILPHEAIIKGDQKSISIGAASIVAKVTRDQIMEAYHELYPHYGFNQHKGYLTAHHQAMIEKHGPSPIHRMSFAPLKWIKN